MTVLEASERFGLFTKEDAPVPLTGVKVEGTITGRTAKVTLRQRFENREGKPIEAVYKFPLPENSSVCGFTVATGDRVLRGRVEEREQAFREYDEALAQGHGAFLLDEERPNIFTLSVGNVKPRHAVDIEVAYVTTLETNGAEVRFMLPTTISPRYLPADTPLQGGIPVGEFINPELRLNVPYGLQLYLDVLGRKDIAGIECPSHSVRTSYTDDAVVVELSNDSTAMDHDFVLTITHAKGFESRGYSFTDGGHTYVQVDFSPRREEALPDFKDYQLGPPDRPEVIFLLDCSGSMGGSSIAQAKKALEVFLRGVPEGTLFNVYRFGSNFHKLFPGSVDYSQETLATVLKLLAPVDADLGGTELLSPLRDIYSTPVAEGFRRNIILLTDGQVGNEADILKLAQGDSRTRLFTVGIGFGPNEYLVKKLAALTGGATESVAPGERIEPKVLRLFSKVTQGVLEDLEVDWGAPAEQAPLRAVVHEGECVSLLARLAGGAAPEVVKLNGWMDGTNPEWAVAVKRVEGAEVALPLLWARARISDLEEGVVVGGGSRQAGRKEKARDGEIVALSKRYGLLSRATSFITVESRVDAEKSMGEIELRKVPSVLTRGWGGMQVADAMLSFQADAMAAPYVAQAALSDSLERHMVHALPSFTLQRESESSPVDPLSELLSMQAAAGGFVVADDAQAVAVGLDVPALRQAASKVGRRGAASLKLVTTAVILALLGERFASRRDEWFAVTEKSRKWFESEVKRLKPAIDGKPLEAWAKEYVKTLPAVDAG
jgi:Ca-activated chloride channel family protein